MTKHKRLEVIFQKTFRSSELTLSPELTSRNVPGWDSLKHIHLISEIEKEFSIRFTTSEILNLQNAGDLLKIIEARGT